MSSQTGPAAGPTSGFVHASWARRILALFLDWLACYGVAFFILRDIQHPAFGWLTTLVFLGESAFGVALTGASFGQYLLRIRVHQLDGRPLTLFRALQRQLLVCLVIPPLVFREDGRGLHDLWTKSGAFEVR
jgi:uncharacterized RDD family membrane protein YckC